jgi:general secretion pathway protein G
MARRRGAFTLVEILIVVVILGILATIVVPQFSNASQQARENTLKDELRYLRTQVVVFKAQHNDVAPGYPAGNASATPTQADFVNQMTEYSNQSFSLGTTPSPSLPYGIYLSQMPMNPVNGLNTMTTVANGATFPTPDGSTGWIYQPSTQQIEPNVTGNDNSGVPYSSY